MKCKDMPDNILEQHDHRACVDHVHSAIAKRDKPPNLTPARTKVLELLLSNHRAMGAYELLEGLQAEGFAAQPPVAYRALDYLMEHGLVHKIERLNAFVACTHPHEQHEPGFIICTSCNLVAETQNPEPPSSVDKTAQQAGFVISEIIVEALGLCPNCQANP